MPVDEPQPAAGTPTSTNPIMSDAVDVTRSSYATLELAARDGIAGPRATVNGMRVVGAVAAVSLLAGCGGSTRLSSAPPPDAGGPSLDATVVTAGDDSSTVVVGSDGAIDSAALGPDPPATACSTDASGCPSPPPACVNSYTAVDYSEGVCTTGQCVWQKNDLDCQEVGGTCVGSEGADAGIDIADVDGSAWVNIRGCKVTAPAQPAPPQTACDGAASPEGGVCPPPASTCSSTLWLTYFDDGQCVAGYCSWQERSHYCQGEMCGGGACAPLFHTAPD